MSLPFTLHTITTQVHPLRSAETRSYIGLQFDYDWGDAKSPEYFYYTTHKILEYDNVTKAYEQFAQEHKEGAAASLTLQGYMLLRGEDNPQMFTQSISVPLKSLIPFGELTPEDTYPIKDFAINPIDIEEDGYAAPKTLARKLFPHVHAGLADEDNPLGCVEHSHKDLPFLAYMGSIRRRKGTGTLPMRVYSIRPNIAMARHTESLILGIGITSEMLI